MHGAYATQAYHRLSSIIFAIMSNQSFEDSFNQLLETDNNEPLIQNNTNPHMELQLANGRLIYMLSFTEDCNINIVYAGSVNQLDCQIPNDKPQLNQFIEHYAKPRLVSPTLSTINAIVFALGMWYRIESLRIAINTQTNDVSITV